MLLRAAVIAAALALLLPAAAFAGGFDTPAEATSAFFDAMKAGDKAAMAATMTEDHAADYLEYGWPWFRCIKLASHEVVETVYHASTSASVLVHWSAKADINELSAAMLEMQVADFKKDGIEGDELAARIAEAKEQIAAGIGDYHAAILSPRNTVNCTNVDGRWYVEIVAFSDRHENEAAAVAAAAMAAVTARDIAALRKLLDQEANDMFEAQGGPAFVAALTVTSSSVGYFERDANGEATVHIRMEGSFDAAGAGEKMAAMIRKSLTAAGLTGETLEATVAQQTRAMQAQLDEMAEGIAAGHGLAMGLLDIALTGQWKVVNIRAWESHDAPQPGGDDNDAEQQVAQTLDMFVHAIRVRNADRIAALLPPDDRAEAEANGSMVLLSNMIVDGAVSIGEVEIDGSAATVGFHWSARLDVDPLLEATLARERENAAAKGLAGDELEAYMAATREAALSQITALDKQFSAGPMLADLELINGCWYVRNLRDSAGPTVARVASGATSPEEALTQLFAAWSAGNHDDAIALLSSEVRGMEMPMAILSELIHTLTITSYEITGQSQPGDNEALMTYTLKATFDVEAFVRNSVEMRLAMAGSMDDAERAKLKTQYEAEMRSGGAAFEKKLAGGKFVAAVVREHGRWFISEPFGD
ncbi:MAG: hypothetical protein AB7K09_00830 [Planctomycetota bacterium]